jgi:hypothetical protein
MKYLLAIISAGLTAAGPSQESPVAFYRSTDGNTEMSYRDMQLKQESDSLFRLIVTGGIHIASKRDNLEITADHATTYFVNQSKKTTLKSVHAEKGVTITKRDGARTSTIDSSVADYKADGTNSTADFHGSVVLSDTNAERKVVVHATGNEGHAVFSAGIQAKNSELKTAVLRGDVVVNVDQAPMGDTKRGKLVIHCSKLTYHPAKSNAELDLDGNVRMDGTIGAISGIVRNLQTVTIHLNSKYEATDYTAGTAH